MPDRTVSDRTVSDRADQALASGLSFERPILELERKIAELKAIPDVSLNGELKPLARKRDKLLAKIYGGLTAWQKVLVARHSERPQFSDYVDGMCEDFVELHGDRLFGEDRAISTGFARLGAHKVLMIGHRKGKETREKLACNFGCAHPEGYRKALAKNMKSRRALRPSDRDDDQHAGCLPGGRRRGTGPGLGHRREHPGDVPSARCPRSASSSAKAARAARSASGSGIAS